MHKGVFPVFHMAYPIVIRQCYGNLCRSAVYQANARNALQAQTNMKPILTTSNMTKPTGVPGASMDERNCPRLREVLTNGRIALLLEGNGNSIQSEKYWAVAENEAKSWVGNILTGTMSYNR